MLSLCMFVCCIEEVHKVTPHPQMQKTPIPAPTEQRLNVVVPAGCVPGQMLTIATPTGKQVTVQVPLGVYAGQSFQVIVR